MNPKAEKFWDFFIAILLIENFFILICNKIASSVV